MPNQQSARRIAARIGPAILGQLCVHAAMAGMRMAAPLWALEAGYGKAAVGLLVAIFSIAQIFICLPAGRHADRHRLRRPMALCVVLAVPGFAAAVAWPGYPALCIAAILSGASVAIVTITVQRHVGRAVDAPVDLRRAFSLVSLAPATANALGPIIAGQLIDGAGFRPAFAALASLPVIAWLLVLASPDKPGHGDAAQPAEGSAWQLMAAGPMRRLLFMNVLMVSTWEFHGFMVPVLGHERGFAASAIGAVLGAFALGAVVVRIGVPTLLERLNEAALIGGALAVSGLLLLAYPFTASAAQMLGCSTVLGMAIGAIQPSVLSMLHNITPPHQQGQALAVRLVSSNVSSLAIPLVLGLTGGLVSVSGVFWVMGAAVAAGSRVRLARKDRP